jgi:DNA-binding NtrC family response regulator
VANSRNDGVIKRLLLVEPDAAISQWLRPTFERIAKATICGDFLSARSQLLSAPPDILITNLRLGEYNGLHLLLLATSDRGVTRSVVYSDRPDPYLIREAQTLGGFFELTERLPYALAGYVHLALPERDRRGTSRYDRRAGFRGGRRGADVAISS